MANANNTQFSNRFVIIDALDDYLVDYGESLDECDAVIKKNPGRRFIRVYEIVKAVEISNVVDIKTVDLCTEIGDYL